MRRSGAIAIALALTFAGTGCATKSFVRSNVGATNDTVNELVEALEETQARTARHERRIGEVDEKTSSARRVADAARATARSASAAATAAGSRLETIDRASKRLVYDVALEAEEANYRPGQAELSEAARVRIDGIIHSVMDEAKNVFIEIEGHTDNRGSSVANARVAQQRAQEVRRYLYEVHQIPLHKMNVISYGAQKPAAPNATDRGRARNRRVVIRVRA